MASLKQIISKFGVPVIGLNVGGLVLFLLVVINFENSENSRLPQGLGDVPVDANKILQSIGQLPGTEEALFTKPIFHQGRFAAAPIVVQQVQIAAPTLNLELTGILKISDQKGWAFLMPTGGSETQQVGLGETIQGWTLQEIQEASAVLVNGDQKITLSLGQEKIQSAEVSSQKKPRTRRKR